ncbi:MAG TPA: siphovirus ReqiPepy6 Gp37-like family protein, partial [Anaerovoracaceae bacterium]|nr:siphovirus ReqiPepy6 Gp37-like family protein [Anaerovoracaceae bacterium]
MKTLNVIDLQFNYKAAIRGFESVIINRVWNGIGNLTMTINSEITNSNLIQINNIIWFDQEYSKAFIVEKIEETLSGNTINYEISATSINTILKDYITIPPNLDYDSINGTRETIVRAWVDDNCINPTDTSRVQYPLVLGAYKGLGDTLTEQTRYKYLSDEISRVLITENLGYSVDVDLPNKQFIFNVNEGVNRTSLQAVNSRILFGLKYGNIAEYKKVTDTISTRNIVYVAGQGEGAERTIVKVSGSGTRKKESFIDARDIDLIAALTERGNQSLTELAQVNNYEFETIERQFIYGVDYDLGDYVTIAIDKDNLIHQQFQKVKEVYEAGNIS